MHENGGFYPRKNSKTVHRRFRQFMLLIMHFHPKMR